MDLENIYSIIISLGAVATGISSYLAFRTYQKSKQESQVESLKESILKFEHNYNKVFEEFDSTHLITQVNKIIHNKSLIKLVDDLFEQKDLDKEKFSNFVDSKKVLINNIVISTLNTNEETNISKAVDSLLLAEVSIKSKYPILHNYIQGVNIIVQYAVNILKEDDSLEYGIGEILLESHQNKEFKKKGVEGMLALLSNVILNAFEDIIVERNLNELLEALLELNEFVLNIYLNGSVKEIYKVSNEELNLNVNDYKSNCISKNLWLIIDAKSKYLGKNQAESQYYVNLISNYLNFA